MGLGGIRVRIFNSYGQFSYIKVGLFKGVYISRAYYPDVIIPSYPWIGMSWNLLIEEKESGVIYRDTFF